jgi:hypothetical protein
VDDIVAAMTSQELIEAWDDLHESTPPGWYVGKPTYDERRDEWTLYGFDTSERAKIGRRQREWTAVAPTQSGVVRSMASCLREIRAGRVPK